MKILKPLLREIRKESEIAVRQGLTQLVLSDKNISEKRLPIPDAVNVSVQ